MTSYIISDRSEYTTETNSLSHNDQILDTNISTEEIEIALRTLKLGRSKDADNLKTEHLLYGSRSIHLWLKRIFDAIIAFEEVPSCLKDGVIVPVYKGKRQTH